jgi:hypothetical protein
MLAGGIAVVKVAMKVLVQARPTPVATLAAGAGHQAPLSLVST